MNTTEEQKMTGLQRMLRTKLYETGLRAQVMNISNQGQVKETFDGINELTGLARLTAVHEEKTLFPSLAITAPFMVSLLEQELEKINLLLEKLNVLMDHWEHSFSIHEKSKLVQKVQFAFNDWMAQQLQYMNKLELLGQDSAKTEVEDNLMIVAA